VSFRAAAFNKAFECILFDVLECATIEERITAAGMFKIDET
jgi:hypothetical protein